MLDVICSLIRHISKFSMALYLQGNGDDRITNVVGYICNSIGAICESPPTQTLCLLGNDAYSWVFHLCWIYLQFNSSHLWTPILYAKFQFLFALKYRTYPCQSNIVIMIHSPYILNRVKIVANYVTSSAGGSGRTSSRTYTSFCVDFICIGPAQMLWPKLLLFFCH